MVPRGESEARMATTQVVVTPKGQPILCPICKSANTGVNYEHLCPYGWTHWWTDGRNVGPDDPNPVNGTKPVGLKCPGCSQTQLVPAKSLACASCGKTTPF